MRLAVKRKVSGSSPARWSTIAFFFFLLFIIIVIGGEVDLSCLDLG